jgi:hypothetical protein
MDERLKFLARLLDGEKTGLACVRCDRLAENSSLSLASSASRGRCDATAVNRRWPFYLHRFSLVIRHPRHSWTAKGERPDRLS